MATTPPAEPAIAWITESLGIVWAESAVDSDGCGLVVCRVLRAMQPVDEGQVRCVLVSLRK